MRHRGTGRAIENRQRTTENVGQTRSNDRQRSAMPQTTQATTCKTALDNVQHGTIYTPDDMQHATGKMHLTTRSVQQTTTRQHAAYSGKYAANNKRHATRNRQHAPDFKQHAADNNDVQRNMQHATGNVQHARDNVEFGKDHWQQDTRQQETRQHAVRGRQRAKDGITRQRMQQATCIRQQTTCKSTRAHARCKRKHTASPHFVCGEQQAADNQQHARSIVLANQCATRHRRHTHDVTHDRCRSMQQTHAEPTPRSRH
jgi:hypothetical protein